MLPKNIQTVITKNSGFIVPKELFELILKKKPNAFGYVVQDGEGLSVGREEGAPDMAALEEMNTETVAMRSILTFGWMSEGFDKDDLLPFALYDGEEPFLTFALEGDFPKYDTNNGRTQEYNVTSEIIAPSLSEICELTGGDVERLMATIGKPMFNNNFLGAVGHRGVLSILAPKGDFVNLSKNELGEVYDWGSTSQKHGFGDVKQEPVKIEEKKARFSFGGKKAEAPSAPKAEVKDAATAGTAPRASVPAVAKKEETKASEPQPIRPPAWCHSNDDKKSWYQAVCGNLPKGWKHNIPVIPTVGVTPPAKIEDLQAWRAAKKKEAIAATTVKPAAPVTQTSAGPVKTAEEVKEIKAEENLPIIPAKDMEKVLDFVAKHIDGQSVQMINPADIQAIEKKFPALSECLGLKPQELLNWSPSSLFALAKHDSRAIVLMALEFRNLWRNTLKLEDLTGTLNTEKANDRVTTTVTKTGEGTTKVESVSNEAPPAKKKMFSFGKKAA